MKSISGFRFFKDHMSFFAKSAAISRDLTPCSIQKFLTDLSGFDNVIPDEDFGWEKNVGLKSKPIFKSFAQSTHLEKLAGEMLSRLMNFPLLSR